MNGVTKQEAIDAEISDRHCGQPKPAKADETDKGLCHMCHQLANEFLIATNGLNAAIASVRGLEEKLDALLNASARQELRRQGGPREPDDDDVLAYVTNHGPVALKDPPR